MEDYIGFKYCHVRRVRTNIYPQTILGKWKLIKWEMIISGIDRIYPQTLLGERKLIKWEMIKSGSDNTVKWYALHYSRLLRHAMVNFALQ